MGDGPQGGGRLATSEHDGREWRGSNDTKDKGGIPKKKKENNGKLEHERTGRR